MFLCHVVGTWLNEQRHYDYPGLREHFCYPWRKRVLEEEVEIMADIEQEERQTYFQDRSREFGFNGLREHFCYSWRKRVLEEEVEIMADIEQEERQTYFH